MKSSAEKNPQPQAHKNLSSGAFQPVTAKIGKPSETMEEPDPGLRRSMRSSRKTKVKKVHDKGSFQHSDSFEENSITDSQDLNGSEANCPDNHPLK